VARFFRLSLGLLAAGISVAQAKDPCTITKRNGSTAAYDMLEKIAGVVPFDRQSYFLYESQDPLVRGRAWSKLCEGTERWIVYDPAYIDSIRQKDGNSNLPFYFVLAHEAAHHVLDHTQGDWDLGYWGPQQELAADHAAAIWVTRAVRVSREDLLRAFDALGLPEQADPKAGYPSRADRRAKVTQGYEEELARTRSPGEAQAEPKPSAPAAPTMTQPLDPFREALLRRLDEVRANGEAKTRLPGAIKCDGVRCTLFSPESFDKSWMRFQEMVKEVEAALQGQGWEKRDPVATPVSTLTVFNDPTMKLWVGVQLWVPIASDSVPNYDVDVIVGKF
jgi:hypothetical protein